MRQEILFKPGYDYRDDVDDQRGADPLSVWFVYGDDAAILTVRVSTGWMLRPLLGTYSPMLGEQRRADKPGADYGLERYFPTGSGVALHAREQLGDRDESHSECEWLGGTPCYGDVSYLLSDEFVTALVAGGSDGAWEWMRKTREDWLS
jgi:hypothetical protein